MKNLKKGQKVSYQHTVNGKKIQGTYHSTYKCHGKDYHLVILKNGQKCSTKKETKFSRPTK